MKISKSNNPNNTPNNNDNSKKTKTRTGKGKLFALSFLALCFGILVYSSSYISTDDPIKNINTPGFSTLSNKNQVTNKLEGNEEKVFISLIYNDKEFNYKGEKMPTTQTLIMTEYDKYACTSSLGGFLTFVENIANEVEIPCKEVQISFNEKGVPVATAGENGKIIDKTQLFSQIDESLKKNFHATIALPMIESTPKLSAKEVNKNLVKRSEFSTSYKSSSEGRKNNVKLALSNFNGMVVYPGDEISFNKTTGKRSTENGYKKANVILNGEYVEGVGGGVCQASTTLYNALIRSDIEILEVKKHTMPASYVPLAFDAMVAEGTSDLRFCNNLDMPIIIKTWGDNEKVYVQIYGKPFENGEKIVPRAQFVRTIPHSGDKIIKDTDGTHSDLVMFKGEYHRIKYPREGYESKAYLDYYINGNLIESKLIRNETYQPQEGIIVEGVGELGEGMTLPKNTVKIIPPQTKSELKTPTESELESSHPAKYNP